MKMVKNSVLAAIGLMILVIVLIVMVIGAKFFFKDQQHRIGGTVVNALVLVGFGIIGSGAGITVLAKGLGADLKIPGLGG